MTKTANAIRTACPGVAGASDVSANASPAEQITAAKATATLLDINKSPLNRIDTAVPLISLENGTSAGPTRRAFQHWYRKEPPLQPRHATSVCPSRPPSKSPRKLHTAITGLPPDAFKASPRLRFVSISLPSFEKPSLTTPA